MTRWSEWIVRGISGLRVTITTDRITIKGSLPESVSEYRSLWGTVYLVADALPENHRTIRGNIRSGATDIVFKVGHKKEKYVWDGEKFDRPVPKKEDS